MSNLVEESALVTMPFVDNDYVINPVSLDNKEGRLVARANIDSYEDALRELVGSERGEMDEINDNGLKEYIVDGMYTRELFIPKGVTIVSKLWNRERQWIIASGEVTFTTEAGLQRIKAPYVATAPYGSKVALFAHEDTLWFATSRIKTDKIEEAEDEVSANDYSDCTYPWDKLENKGEQ